MGQRPFRLMMLLWPADFRRVHGDEAASDYAAERAELARGRAGWLPRAWFWRRVLADVVVTAIALRIPGDGNRNPGSGRGPSRAWRLDGLRLDLRHAARAIARVPLFAGSLVVTLALGIGATTAVFAIVDAVLVRPIPYLQPDRLLDLGQRMEAGFTIPSFPAGFARELGERANAEAFVRAVLYQRLNMVLSVGEVPRDVRVQAVGAAFFEVLGRAPLLGRGIAEDDARAGAAPVAVLSHGMWRALGPDAASPGRVVELDGLAFTVIGVMPADFRFPTAWPADLFVPLAAAGRAAGIELPRLSLLARRSEGTSLDAATERLGAITEFIRDEQSLGGGWSTAVIPMGGHRANSDVARALWLAAGAVGMMFLIAVVNGLNLLLARIEARAGELAVRASLGASRGRLLRQVLVESLLLAVAAGLVAVSLGAAGIALMMRLAPPELTLQSANGVVVDGRVLGFAFLLTVAAGFVCALVPGLIGLRWADAGTAAGPRSPGTTSREHARVRSALVVGQVAIAMTLMVGAGLLIASFGRLLAVTPGFDADRLVLLTINPNERTYATADQRAALGAELEERLVSVPGVAAVARADGLPPQSSVRVQPALQAREDAEPRADSPILLPWATVRPDYLQVLGTRLVAGRNFTDAEGPDSDVAIIDRDLARFLWSDGAAVGRQFRIGESAPWLTVVGVIDELMLGMPDDSYGEHVLLRPAAATHEGTYFAIRTHAEPASSIPAIREAVLDVAPNQPIYALATARQAIVDELGRQRFFMIVVATMAGIALCLTTIGLYGLLSFTVQRRNREIGIRMALGARARVVLSDIVGGGMKLVGAGILIGLAGALALGRLMRGIIFGIETTHSVTFLGVAALLALVTVLACLVPASRAARVEPSAVLRSE